jgi:hypothetical protein
MTTRRTYLAIASALRQAMPVESMVIAAHEQWRIDCESVADALAADNRAFDRALFLENCGADSDDEIYDESGIAVGRAGKLIK